MDNHQHHPQDPFKKFQNQSRMIEQLFKQQIITQNEMMNLKQRAKKQFDDQFQKEESFSLKKLKFDIGVFNLHNDTPGIKFLVDSLSIFYPIDVQEMIKQVNKGRLERNIQQTTVYQNVIPKVLEENQCLKLRKYVDNQWDGQQTDFKSNMNFEELKRIIGEETAQNLSSLMENDYDEIIIRRCLAVPLGLCINFHVDYSLKTMQIALNNDQDYVGGRLIYATEDGVLRVPIRSAGSMTIHNNTIVHGVTKHLEGIRYGLFFLKT